MCTANKAIHISNTTSAQLSIANSCTHARSAGQSASTRKEGKSPAKGAQTNQLNPLSVGPHLPHQGQSALIYWSTLQKRRDHRQGSWERHQTERDLLSLCTHMYRSCYHHAPCPWRKSAHTAWHNTHTNITTHHSTAQHSTAQHSTAQHNPVDSTRHNTTHTISSAFWPLSRRLQYSKPQHSTPIWVQIPCLAWAKESRCSQPPADSNDDNPKFGARLVRQNPIGLSMGRHHSR